MSNSKIDRLLAQIQAEQSDHGRWQDRGKGEFWLDHLTVSQDDVARLVNARDLTLWNVKVPPGFYARLETLERLDLRGGSARDLDPVAEVPALRHLVVNQVRGLADVGAIAHIPNLEILSLYGLAQVAALPSFAPLTRLRAVELGQMRQLSDLSPVAEAPALTELRLIRKLPITAASMRPFVGHPTLKVFGWFWEDVPVSQAMPVLDALPLERPSFAEALT